MSHWYRAPRPISIRELLSRTKQNIILDDTVSSDLLLELPESVHALAKLRLAEKLSGEDAVQLCRRSRGILLTARAEYLQLLSKPNPIPWGLILLPVEKTAKVEALRRISTQKLVFRPAVERSVLVELVRHNRLLVDLRQVTLAICIFCNSHWESLST